MKMRVHFRWAGWWIITSAILMNGMNIVVYAGYHNTTIQGAYAVGFTGLIFTCTVIHIVQAPRAGLPGLLAYLVSVLSLTYANVITFLILAELAGIQEAHQTSLAIWHPVMRTAVYGIFFGLTFLGISIAGAGVLPRWAGILVAIGVALQLPAQYAMETAGPLFFLFTIGGSLLLGAGLVWIGVALWSDNLWSSEEPGISYLDRGWGAPFLILTGLLLAVDAAANMLGGLSFLSGVTHVLSYTALLLLPAVLYAAHGERVGWIGFAGLVFTQLGAALYLITAYLIFAQLSGVIDNNRMLMASWVDIPIGRAGSYLVILGLFLFGIEAIRSGTFPRWSGWLVVIGIALALPFAFAMQAYFLGIFWVLGALLEGIGISWMGWTLLRRRSIMPVSQLREGAS